MTGPLFAVGLRDWRAAARLDGTVADIAPELHALKTNFIGNLVGATLRGLYVMTERRYA